MTEKKVVMTTDIKEYPVLVRGKVRDVYDMGDTLLFVTSDRMSAFDVVLPNGIPGKGQVLTAMSLFWFDFLKDTVDNHLITADVDEYPEPLKKYRDILEGRSMIVTKAERIDAGFLGAGDILSAALTALIATGSELTEAVAEALQYLDQALDRGFRPGMGRAVADRLFWAESDEADSADDDAPPSFDIPHPFNETKH